MKIKEGHKESCEIPKADTANETTAKKERPYQTISNTRRKLNIALIRCPQPLLIGEETGGLYSPNRSLTPEPALPQLAGIIQKCAEECKAAINVSQIDLRDPRIGAVKGIEYGKLELPYLNELLIKRYSGVEIAEVSPILEQADIIGFSSNFSMSRGVVAQHVAEVRRMFPEKELWLGGRDMFTDRVTDVYIDAAERKSVAVFHGHVFESLPAYLKYKLLGEGEPFGVTHYDKEGHKKHSPSKPLNRHGNIIHMPSPIYESPESLSYLTGSGEGMPDPPFGRLVHKTFSIGCPYDCGYCTTGYRERFLVSQDPRTIESELDMYKQIGVTHLAIMDDNFLALGIEKVREIMKMINSYGFQVEYGNGLQLSLLTKWWDQLAEVVLSNCVSLYAPLEDLTQNQMYGKLDPTTDQIALMERLAKEAPSDLKYVTMGVVHGVPGHTKKALSTNFLGNVGRFLNVFQGSEREVAMTVFNFIPLSGSYFGELALNSGRMIVEDPFISDPEVLSFGTASYAPEGMTHGEVFDIYEKALNLNPAGQTLGVDYVTLQRLGERAVSPEMRPLVPSNWRVPGYHMRDKVTTKET